MIKRTGNKKLVDVEAKKAIAEIELMKLKRKKNVYSPPESNGISMGTKITIVVALVLAVVVYTKQYSVEETQVSFEEAKAYCEEQGKLLPLTLEDDPEYLLNLYTVEAGRAYWDAKGGLLYNMELGHMSFPENAKHYVLCVDVNGKTKGDMVGVTKYKY
jgi:hypothetical protein